MVVNNQPDRRTWRQYRTCSPKQNLALDFLTKQGAFRNDTERDRYLLYGGAGWGGKSHLLRTAGLEIGLVLRNLGFPNQWLTLFTATFPDLEDRHIRKFDAELEGFGEIRRSQKHGLHFKFNGEGLGGVYLRNIGEIGKSRKTKRGAESIGALIDESTEITYEQFSQQIMYQIRPGDLPIPFVPFLLATNPDGIGHLWNKKIFHPQYRDLDHPFFKSVSPKSVFFIQSLKSDNPAYLMQKEIIDARMAAIDDPDVRRARDEGAWDLYASGRFPVWKDSVHVFEDEDLLAFYQIPTSLSFEEFLNHCTEFGFRIYGSLDYGTSVDGCSAYYLHLEGPDQRVWTYAVLKMVGMGLEKQAETILKFEAGWAPSGVYLRYCDPALAGKAAESDNKLSRVKRFAAEGVVFRLAFNDRVEGAGSVDFMLQYRRDPNTLIQTTYPRWRVAKRCRDLIEEIPNLPRNPLNPEDVDPMNGIWHHYDSCRYFLHSRRRGSSINRNEIVLPNTPQWYDALAELREARAEDWDFLSD